MNYSAFRQRRYYILLSWVLATIVFASFAMSITSRLINNDNFWRLPAAVVIKTQAAADNIKGGIRGIDVSKWQGSINWAQVARDDVSFVFARASIGTEIDETFVTNARGAHENGLKVGAYHYAKFKTRAEMLTEAKLFVSQLKKVNITYPVVLDLELHGGLSKAKLTDYSLEFMEYVRDAGYSVMFYSYQSFFQDYLDVKRLSQFPFWVANYVEQPNSIDHKLWQHTSSGRVNGITGNVDINIAYSDLSIRKQLKVNKEISDKIKAYLNEHYGAGIDIASSMDFSVIELGMNRALQMEIARQLGHSSLADGNITPKELEVLSAIQFTSSTKGNITTLLQCRLFYKGYYTNMISGQFDEHTAQALTAYQKQNQLVVTGVPDLITWTKLFPPME